MHVGPGVSPEATRWLYEHGIRVMGIDAWGWDAPQKFQVQTAIEKDEPDIFWGAHQVDLDYSQIETPHQPGRAPADRLPGRVLSAEDQARGRRTRPRRSLRGLVGGRRLDQLPELRTRLVAALPTVTWVGERLHGRHATGRALGMRWSVRGHAPIVGGAQADQHELAPTTRISSPRGGVNR